MSTFIAQEIRIDSIDGKIYLRGGDSNVVPRENNWWSYADNKDFFRNLISGTVELKNSSVLADKVNKAMDSIRNSHQKQFGERIERFGDCMISPYSLYSFKDYALGRSKKDYLEGQLKSLLLYVEERQYSMLKEIQIVDKIFDEAVKFYKDAEEFFFKCIGAKIS
jgi:uncharacterized protein (DUF779 family)